MPIRLLPPCLIILGLSAACYGQTVNPVPYDSQLPTDPDVGNVQGIQRHGRQLSTDPDVGTGFSYHVNPIGYIPVPSGPQALPAGWTLGAGGQVPEGQAGAQPPGLRPFKPTGPRPVLPNPWRFKATSPDKRNLRSENVPGPSPAFPQGGPFPAAVSQAKPAAEGTGQILPVSFAQQAPAPDAEKAPAPHEAPVSAYAVIPGLPLQQQTRAFETLNVVHQPLIQVKMRVVEVSRNDTLQVSSVLDFIGQKGNPNTLIRGNNINHDMRNVSGATRFSVVPPTLIGVSSNALSAGSGALVNLTTGNLNWIASWLATEFHSDVLTAPEVVVLNGQTVELISGSKVPFLIGQNVITGSGQNNQQFFYKHVGTYISVTPQIVNWGIHAEGSGKAHLQESEIADCDWERFVLALDTRIKGINTTPPTMFLPNWPKHVKDVPDAKVLKDAQDAALKAKIEAEGKAIEAGAADPKDPKNYDLFKAAAEAKTRADDAAAIAAGLQSKLEIFKFIKNDGRLTQAAKTFILDQLATYYSRGDLIALGLPICCKAGCNGCDWHAEDCTVDLNVVARFSDADNTTFQVPIPSGAAAVATSAVPIESNVRAISNIVQVKSGHGVVMGGVIGEHDVKDFSKVPVLGDIPVVGALFRSKSTNRQKTELLIFIEAQVLDPCPEEALAQSYHNFLLGEGYVAGEFLDNPLEFGMYRAGFGAYLPPHSAEEKIFWERLGRKVRKVATELDDTFE